MYWVYFKILISPTLWLISFLVIVVSLVPDFAFEYLKPSWRKIVRVKFLCTFLIGGFEFRVCKKVLFFLETSLFLFLFLRVNQRELLDFCFVF